MQFVKADGTEIQWPPIRLFKVVRALHDTVHPLAALDSKHVANFMGYGLQTYVYLNKIKKFNSAVMSL